MRQVNATIFFVLYLAFLAWYGGWGMSPLTEAEVESYIANLGPGAEDAPFVNRLRAMAANDTGGEIFMLNLNRYEYADGETRDGPPATYQNYGAGVVPMILANAGHPMYSGRFPSFTAIGQSDWDEVILVRYRSRRDFHQHDHFRSIPGHFQQTPGRRDRIRRSFSDHCLLQPGISKTLGSAAAARAIHPG